MSLIISLLSAYFGEGTKKAIKDVNSLSDELKQLSKNAVKGFSAFELAKKGFGFMQETVTAASDLQRNMAGVKTIFGESASEMGKYISASEKLGMSHAAAAKSVTFLGSVFKQTGMPMDSVISKTQQMVNLGADLAATYGYSVDEALTAMTATFRGEYDPIEKFGVAMKQSQVNTELAARGQAKLTGAALIAAQQQIRYEMILQRTTDAQGAYSRQTNSFFVQQQNLNAAFQDLQATLGKQLLPGLTNLMTTMQPIIRDLAPHMIGTFQALGAAIVGTSGTATGLGKSLGKAFDAITGTVKMFAPLISGLIKFIMEHLESVVAFVAAFRALKMIGGIVQAIKSFQAATKAATAAQVALNIAMDANPLGLVAAGIAGLIALIVNLNVVADDLNNKFAKETPAAMAVGNKAAAEAVKTMAVAEQSRYAGLAKHLAADNARTKAINDYKDALKEATKAQKEYENNLPTVDQINAHHGWTPKTDTSSTGTKTAKVNPIKDFYAKLADEVKQQQALFILESKKFNLPVAFAESIVGSGAGWEKVFNDIKGKSAKQIAKMVSDWYKTAAGIKAKTDAQSAGSTVLKDFYSGLADEASKQSASTKLMNLGLSSGLVDAIMGSSDWETIFKDVIGKSHDALVSMQQQFNTTGAGIAEIDAIAQKAYDDATSANQAAQDFRKSVSDALMNTSPLDFAEKAYGRFESAVNDSFANVSQSLHEFMDNKPELAGALKNLTEYANSEKTILGKIARQRDVIAEKISIAKTISASVRDFGNVTQMLGSGAEQVTESFKKVIDGVEVTFSKAVSATDPQALIDNYKAVVQKTKDFGLNLKTLKANGLDNNLFKQIVDAGVDAGGATAAAIVAGGSSTIAELNGLFADLNATGSDIAQTSTDVMYAAGTDIVNGFIQSLMDSDKALQDQATAMATAFSDAFNNSIKLVVPDVVVPPAPQPKVVEPIIPPVVPPVNPPGPSPSVADLGGIGGLVSGGLSVGEAVKALAVQNMMSMDLPITPDSRNAPGSNTSTVNVTVNAGLGTNGNDVGMKIVQILKQYERNNGAVWTAA